MSREMKFSTDTMDRITNIFKNYFYKLLLKSKACSIFEPFYSGLGSILLFHRVVPEADRIHSLLKFMSVTPDYLESCIIYFLERNYQILSLDKVYDSLKSGSNKKKFVCFTFDDGYVDIYRYVYPLFNKYNLPFTAFITTGFPDKEAFMWWEMLDDMILTKDCVKFPKGNNFRCSTWTEKNSVFKMLVQEFLTYKPHELKDILQGLLGLDERDLYNKQEGIVASWDQIIEMSNNPNVTIGSHTVNHSNLYYLTTNEIEYEILESKAILESKIKRKVDHFSYPFGSKPEAGNRQIAILKNQGFKTATTTRTGNIFPEHIHSLGSLPRIQPKPLVEGFGPGIQYLPFWLSGGIPAVRNYGKRVIKS